MGFIPIHNRAIPEPRWSVKRTARYLVTERTDKGGKDSTIHSKRVASYIQRTWRMVQKVRRQTKPNSRNWHCVGFANRIVALSAWVPPGSFPWLVFPLRYGQRSAGRF